MEDLLPGVAFWTRDVLLVIALHLHLFDFAAIAATLV